MLGLMQDWPLLCHRIMEHAARIHGSQEIVTRSVEGPIHRTNYAEIHKRALKISQRLDRDGIKLGDRVATIAWNTWRHLEAWYGIMGIGAICHTVNPRLFPDQIAWIINHAEDRVVMTDLTFIPILEKIAGNLPSVERYIVFTDKAHMPQTTGVPTAWLMLLNHMAANHLKLPHLRFVVCGGSAMPRSMIKSFVDMGVTVRHAWGMTEMSPIGTLAALKPPFANLEGDARLDILQTQGYPPFGVQMKITDDEGKDLPWDGKTFGRLKVSGPAVSKAYFRVDANILDDDGYFDTGDVATIDEHGYMRITDRSQDVIRSGGEWISSIDLENLAVGHPKVAEAAVIGVYHPKWDERPLLIVQLKQGESATREDTLKYMDGKIAKWWMPDDVVFVDAIPHTATGKILKTALRDQFKSYSFPTAAARGIGRPPWPGIVPAMAISGGPSGPIHPSVCRSSVASHGPV